jgi:hypothetical protein
MRLILQTLSQIQRTSSSLRYVTCGPGHIQSIFSIAYIGFNIQLKVAPLLFEVSDASISVILQTWWQLQRTSSSFRYVISGPAHIQFIYSSAHSNFNIHLNVSELLLEISRQFNARYTANLVPNTAHILRFTLCELSSRTYTKYLQLRIFRP